MTAGHASENVSIGSTQLKSRNKLEEHEKGFIVDLDLEASNLKPLRVLL